MFLTRLWFKELMCAMMIVLIFCGLAYAIDMQELDAQIFAEEHAKELARVETKNSIHPWELATEIYHFSYREPDVMRENGMMYGLTGSYAYHKDLMLKAEGRGSIGRVDYKNSGTMDNIRDYSFEFRGLGGYDFPVLEKVVLTPYFGVGYRYLNDDSSGKITSTGAGGYERASNYIYSPVGIEGVIGIKDDWTFGAKAEYDIFWWGRQISNLSDANSRYSDLKNTQRSGYGLRGSVKLQKNGEVFDLMIEPFVRYWNIAKSNDSDVVYSGAIVDYGYEPKNNTTEYGVKVGAKF